MVFDRDLVKYSPSLAAGQIPPRDLRFNVQGGWLTADSQIRWRLERLKTSDAVADGNELRYPGFDEDDILLAIIPASIQTTPEIWAQENHFSTHGALFGGPLKTLMIVYHTRLLNEKGEILQEFFKEYNEDMIAQGLIEDIAREHMGVSDPQMLMVQVKYGYDLNGKPKDEGLFKKLRVLFYGNDLCTDVSMKRAILLFDDIHFHDKPGYFFGEWGGIGAPSRIRNYVRGFAEEGVPVLVHKAVLGGVDDGVMEDAVAHELEDRKFSEIFLDGFRSDSRFRNLFVQEQGDYVSGKGYEISEAILKLELGGRSYDLSKYKKPTVRPFDPHNAKSMEETFVTLLAGASVMLNLTCSLGYERDLIPFTEYPAFQKLLDLRYKRATQLANSSPISTTMGIAQLSFKIFDAVIPQEALAEISFKDVIKYRAETRPIYERFRVHLLKLNAEIETQPWSPDFEKKVEYLLQREIAPAAVSYQNESQRIWDKMFSGMLKSSVKAVSGAGLTSFFWSCYTGQSWADIFVKGCGLASPLVLPHLIDAAQEKRHLRRINSLSYLFELKEKIG